MQISGRQVGQATIFDVVGDIDLANSPQLRKALLREIREMRRPRVVMNLIKVRYIDSSGVGMIVFQQKTLRQSGGDMKLLHLNRRSETLFGMLKLLIVFETFEDEAAAVRSFTSPVKRPAPSA